MHMTDRRTLRSAGRRTATLALVLTAALSAHAVGAQVTIPVAPQSQPVVLRGATIHTVTKGTIPNGTIVLDKGRILAIGGAEEIGRAHV